MPKADPDALIARVREIALALPGTTEKLSHGEPSFFVRGRQFAMMDNNHHGSGHIAVWCNAAAGAQEVLMRTHPDHFFVPPYVGGNGWVGMCVDRGLPWGIVADVLREAHAITGVKKRSRV